MARSSTRRRFLKGAAAVPLLPAAAAPARAPQTGVYARLGVRPVINGIGTVTVLGGSLMPPEVVKAMDEAALYFVNMPDLQKKAGEKLAEMIGVPAAMVTAGAASSITVAAAACIARGDDKLLSRLPDVTGARHEVIVQKAHRFGYEAQVLLTGAKLIWIDTRQELDAAINDRTSMMFFLNKNDPDGKIKRDEWIRVGRERGVPTFNDAAADVPPASNLSQYVKDGFDLVAYSGGKGLMGPQCSGLLLGRKDLVDAGRQAISPHGGIGRCMKVGKEEIVGLIAAVERYLRVDHDAEFRELDGRVKDMIEVLSKIPGVEARRFVPEIANHVPHLEVRWTEGSGKPAASDVVKKLLDGEPSIAVSGGGGRVTVSVWMMRPGEHRVVAKRMKEALA